MDIVEHRARPGAAEFAVRLLPVRQQDLPGRLAPNDAAPAEPVFAAGGIGLSPERLGKS